MTEAQSEYVIVKREPTQEMVEAGKIGFSNAISIHPIGRINPAESSIYAAMLSASPRPETVLTDAERTEAVFKGIKEAHTSRGCIEYCVARAVESAILKKLGAA